MKPGADCVATYITHEWTKSFFDLRYLNIVISKSTPKTYLKFENGDTFITIGTRYGLRVNWRMFGNWKSFGNYYETTNKKGVHVPAASITFAVAE